MSGAPNILYIHSHDTGRYVQPYGFALPTPRLQQLAEDGVLFRQAFNAAPTCSPSRAALLTGQSPHSCGQFGLTNRGFELHDRPKHLAHTWRRAGYHTVLVGVHHIVRDPITCGYGRWIQAPDRRSATIASEAVEFLSHAPRQPFFLAVGFADHARQVRRTGAGRRRPLLPPAAALAGHARDTPRYGRFPGKRAVDG